MSQLSTAEKSRLIRGIDRMQKEFEAHMRQNEIDNAYRDGSFYEVLL